MRKVLLDTNAYSHLLRGDERIFQTISDANLVYMSIFVVGELFAGFKGGTNELSNKEILNKFLEKPTVKSLDATIETAEVFGQIKDALKQTGTPIPMIDIWIAAHAVETGSVLITYDKHFLKVRGLRIWDYING